MNMTPNIQKKSQQITLVKKESQTNDAITIVKMMLVECAIDTFPYRDYGPTVDVALDFFFLRLAIQKTFEDHI